MRIELVDAGADVLLTVGWLWPLVRFKTFGPGAEVLLHVGASSSMDLILSRWSIYHYGIKKGSALRGMYRINGHVRLRIVVEVGYLGQRC